MRHVSVETDINGSALDWSRGAHASAYWLGYVFTVMFVTVAKVNNKIVFILFFTLIVDIYMSWIQIYQFFYVPPVVFIPSAIYYVV